MPSRLDAALTYAANGWRVFPLRGKLPAIAKADGGRGVHDATLDEETIKGWWEKEELNIGIACGASSGIWVLDIDGDDGEESLAILETEHGNLPDTVESHTGRGRHLFFKFNGEAIGNKVAVRAGLDTRADGGYVVAPPSYHKDTKKDYIWSVDGDPEDMEPVDAPTWLIELIGTNDAATKIEVRDATETFTDAYGEAALKAEAEAVADAAIGKQENTLNNAALKIGALVGSGHIGYDDALELLVAAGLTMTCDPKRDAWSEAEIRDKVKRALADGMNTPREPKDDTGKPEAKEDKDTKPRLSLISARDFVDGFEAPDFLVEDLVQRRYCYSLTGRTGHGKTAVVITASLCVAAGIPFAGRRVEQGAVAFFAGENADDVRARTIMTAEHFDISFDGLPLYFFDRPFDIMKAKPEIERQVDKLGGLALIIIDTAAAFFQGQDENSNTELGNFARDMGSLCKLPGGPCVIINCHPTKSATKSSLVPRGGGAFVAEVDGNLRVWSDDKETTELHWFEKLRGPGFEPVTFRLEGKTSERVKDSKGRTLPNVVAVPMAEDELKAAANVTRSHEDAMLEMLLQYPGSSFAEWAEKLGWLSATGEPRKSRIARTLDRLKEDSLVRKYRGRWALTKAGRIEAENAL